MADFEATKALCREFHLHLSKRRYEDAANLLHSEVEWWIQGNLPISGTYHGRDAVAAQFWPLRDFLVGDLEIAHGELTAEGDRVAVEMRSYAKFNNGKIYRNTYHFLFTV